MNPESDITTSYFQNVMEIGHRINFILSSATLCSHCLLFVCKCSTHSYLSFSFLLGKMPINESLNVLFVNYLLGLSYMRLKDKDQYSLFIIKP